jgi:hypothetical protein
LETVTATASPPWCDCSDSEVCDTELEARVEKLEAAALDHRDRLHLIQNNGVVSTINSLADRVRAIEARLDALDPHVVIVGLEPAKAPSHPKKEGRRPRKASKSR